MLAHTAGSIQNFTCEHESMTQASTVTLHWLPLGAGGRLVRFSGRIWELIAARREGRDPAPLFHSALEVEGPAGTSIVEIAPVVNSLPADHGVVCEGPVGAAWAGRFRIFRYELRCWERGRIPDLEFESGKPVSLSADPAVAARLLEIAPRVPMLVWGRDELRLGEMWNSNSVIAWLLAGAGIEGEGGEPPGSGRAPGWRAGAEAARMVPPSLRS